MLAVAAFVAFWVVVAFGLFYVAARGGPRNVRVASPSRGGNRLIGVVFAFVAIGFGIALPLALLTGNHSHANAEVGGLKLTAAERDASMDVARAGLGHPFAITLEYVDAIRRDPSGKYAEFRAEIAD